MKNLIEVLQPMVFYQYNCVEYNLKIFERKKMRFWLIISSSAISNTIKNAIQRY